MIARMQPANDVPRRPRRADRSSQHRRIRRNGRRSTASLACRTLLAVLTLLGAVGAVGAVGGTAAGAAPVAGTAVAQAQCGTDLAANPAAPRLAVGASTLPATGAATVTVTGTRYLTGRYVCGASKFGGVYVFFGWVQPGGQWGPSWRSATSSAGQFATTYTYPGEGGGGETRDDGSGTLRLVSFTPGGTSGNETPFHMDADGNWSTTLTVAGPVFTWKDLATGASQTVDCRVVQCGIFTMGAHGIASRSNEQFVPVAFAAGSAGTSAPPATTPSNGSGGAAGGAPVQVEGARSGPGAASGSIGADGATSVAGASSTTVVPEGSTTTTPAVGSADGSTTIDRGSVARRIRRVGDRRGSRRVRRWSASATPMAAAACRCRRCSPRSRWSACSSPAPRCSCAGVVAHRRTSW